ncbi:MAG: hypothetical protein IJ466_02010 [Clostridia bacterium]|nr:hypothetical protein [Clostridia bacterium]
MKRLFSIFMLLIILPCFALAETALTLVSPTPSIAPLGTEFSCEAFIVYLPFGMEPLDEAALAGYDAAVQAGFPDTAQTLLAASDPAGEAVACFALMDSQQTSIEAAREAAATILGSPDSAQEIIFGANTAAGFACAVEDITFRLYFFSNGSQLLLVSASGLGDAEVETMLSTLDF